MQKRLDLPMALTRIYPGFFFTEKLFIFQEFIGNRPGGFYQEPFNNPKVLSLKEPYRIRLTEQ